MVQKRPLTDGRQLNKKKGPCCKCGSEQLAVHAERAIEPADEVVHPGLDGGVGVFGITQL